MVLRFGSILSHAQKQVHCCQAMTSMESWLQTTPACTLPQTRLCRQVISAYWAGIFVMNAEKDVGAADNMVLVEEHCP
eukprot:12647402-Ditylum_brightwellii.AAC.1